MGNFRDFCKKKSLSIYSNPVSDYLHIKSDSKVTKTRIFDMLGRKVDAISAKDQINVTYLQPGNYILELEKKRGYDF
ncbi:T9SS type A sorting domain-containing protein [Chryseobacterium sp. MYb264]|uniref:T9SS type A sorting domain-containing protein n=1 Tax=Chryseobacterium sp. MYb264 TaxID=2745153 RepID=UPI002E163B3C|nr:T9SS type A sorting domain-containing protein [Chryseobacterium sp. MYb264]